MPALSLTTRDVAERLSVSRRTVQIWIDRGELPAFKVGRVIRISPDSLDAFILREG